MRTNRVLVSVGAAALIFSSFTGVAAAQSCGSPCVSQTSVDPATSVKGEVVTNAPVVVQSAGATQADGLGVAQGALALTGGDAVGLSVVGAGLLGAGGLIVLGTRRKAEADT
ncbi:MAG: hypothetical protein GY698_19300 [Actinomycetia bacterium]|nr:hypothetical protein [Actinomycetes bacterium]